MSGERPCAENLQRQVVQERERVVWKWTRLWACKQELWCEGPEAPSRLRARRATATARSIWASREHQTFRKDTGLHQECVPMARRVVHLCLLAPGHQGLANVGSHNRMYFNDERIL